MGPNSPTMTQEDFDKGKEGFLKGIQEANKEDAAPTAKPNRAMRRKFASMVKRNIMKDLFCRLHKMKKKKEKNRVKNRIAHKARMINYALAKA